jgi:hypothetical protein
LWRLTGDIDVNAILPPPVKPEEGVCMPFFSLVSSYYLTKPNYHCDRLSPPSRIAMSDEPFSNTTRLVAHTFDQFYLWGVGLLFFMFLKPFLTPNPEFVSMIQWALWIMVIWFWVKGVCLKLEHRVTFTELYRLRTHKLSSARRSS